MPNLHSHKKKILTSFTKTYPGYTPFYAIMLGYDPCLVSHLVVGGTVNSETSNNLKPERPNTLRHKLIIPKRTDVTLLEK